MMILAPVLDVASSAGASSRSYGPDAKTVIDYGLAYADGLAEGGVVPVAKHFPGHGTADADSHVRLPTTAALAEMRALDLVPFEAAVTRVPAVMMGHLDVPDLSDGVPTSLSAAATELLRDELGFDGVIISDDLTMGALRSISPVEAAEAAVAAGSDLIIVGGLPDALLAATHLVEAVGGGRVERARIDEALLRVMSIKGLDPCEVWGS